MIDRKILGQRIRCHRELCRLTLPELAALMGCDIRFVEDVEAGSRDVTLKTISRIAKALDLLPHDLIEVEGQKQDE